MMLLCVAQLAVRLVPLRYWRGTLGRRDGETRAEGDASAARRIAAHVERGAARLPFTAKCLPQAMALCWLLRQARIGYVFKIAARPAELRDPGRSDDALHAWVESGQVTVIGALPGPWLEVLVLRG